MEEKIVERDFEQEVKDLYQANPSLRGEALPESVVKACAGGKKLSEAYDEYAEEQTAAQNAKAARRAPVRSVTRGGGVEALPEDAFLRGFNEAW